MNNTWVDRIEYGEGGTSPGGQKVSGLAYGIRLHNTYVVIYHESGRVELRSGGWETVTTKDRMNSFSPFRVGSNGGEWDVRGYPRSIDGARFSDGMTSDPDGGWQEHKAAVFARYMEGA